MSEGIGHGTNVVVLNVELEWEIRFEGDAVFVAWFTYDGAEGSSEDSCDRGFQD